MSAPSVPSRRTRNPKASLAARAVKAAVISVASHWLVTSAIVATAIESVLAAIPSPDAPNSELKEIRAFAFEPPV